MDKLIFRFLYICFAQRPIPRLPQTIKSLLVIILPFLFQVEITNDISFLLPIMSAIMTSKWVGDYFTHPLYHALLEFKCIPFLDSEPVVYQQDKHL